MNTTHRRQGSAAAGARGAAPAAALLLWAFLAAVPGAAAPSADAFVASTTVSFAWQGPSTTVASGLGAGASYHLQVAVADSNFAPANIVVSITTPIVVANPNQAFTQGAYFSSHTLLSGSDYYWRVRAYNPQLDVFGPFSGTAHFAVDSAPPNGQAFATLNSTGGAVAENRYVDLKQGATVQLEIIDTGFGLLVSTATKPDSLDFAGGGFGIAYSNDAGQSWKDIAVSSLSFPGSQEGALALHAYRNALYMGQGTGAGDGDIFVYAGGGWTLALDFPINEEVLAFAEYEGKLYAGIGGALAGDGKVYVCDPNALIADGVCRDGEWALSHATPHARVSRLAVYNGALYAATGGGAGSGDVYVFDGQNWSLSHDGTTTAVESLAAFDGRLYAGLSDGDILVFAGTGWTTINLGLQSINALTVINSDLFAAGRGGNHAVLLAYSAASGWRTEFEAPEQAFTALLSANGDLYAGTGGGVGEGDVYAFAASTWTKVYDGAADSVGALAAYEGRLWLGVEGSSAGEGDVLALSQVAVATMTGTDGDLGPLRLSGLVDLVASTNTETCGGNEQACGATNQVVFRFTDRAGNLKFKGPFAILATGCDPVRGAASGNWSDSEIWNPPHVPTSCNPVTIPANVEVTLDGETIVSSATVVQGTLKAHRTLNSRYTMVGGSLTVAQGGSLDYGTAADPVSSSAALVLAYGESPGQYGLVVEEGGRYSAYGNPRTIAYPLETDLASGSGVLNVVGDPTVDWGAGDLVAVLPSQGAGTSSVFVSSVTGFSGQDITMDATAGAVHYSSWSVSAVNLSRNIVFMSSGSSAQNSQSYVLIRSTGLYATALYGAEFVGLGAGAAATEGVRVEGAAASAFVSSCVFRGGENGLSVFQATNVVVHANVAYANAGYGFLFTSVSQATLTYNAGFANASQGARITNSGGAWVYGNQFSGNGQYGMSVNSSGGHWMQSNRFTANGSRGLTFSGTSDGIAVLGSTASFNGSEGIAHQSTNASQLYVTTSVIVGNGGDGLMFANRNREFVILNNRIDENGVNGIEFSTVSSSAVVVGNAIAGNSGAGIRFAAAGGSTLIGNTIRSNGGDGIFYGTSVAFERLVLNDIGDNAESGIEFNNANEVMLISNTVHGNDQYGLYYRGAQRVYFQDGALGYDAAGASNPNSPAEAHIDSATLSGIELRKTRINPAVGLSTAGITGAGRYIAAFSQNYDTGTLRVYGFVPFAATDQFEYNFDGESMGIEVSSVVAMRGDASAFIFNKTEAAKGGLWIIEFDGAVWCLREPLAPDGTCVQTWATDFSGTIGTPPQFTLNFNDNTAGVKGDFMHFAIAEGGRDRNTQKKILFGPTAASYRNGRSGFEFSADSTFTLRGIPGFPTIVDTIGPGQPYYTLQSSGPVYLEHSSITNTDNGGFWFSGEPGRLFIASTTFDFMGVEPTLDGAYITYASDLPAVATTFYGVEFAASRSTDPAPNAYNIRVVGGGAAGITLRKWSGLMGGTTWQSDPHGTIAWAPFQPSSTTVTATAVWESSITHVWSAAVDPVNDPGVFYRVFMSSAQNFSGSVFSSTTARDVYDASVEGLSANTTYYAAIYAVDVGTAPWMGLERKSTLAKPLTPLPDRFFDVQGGSITAAWIGLPATPVEDSAEGYRLEASSTNFDGTGVLFSSTTIDIAVSTLSVGINGVSLELNTTYWFRAASVNHASAPNYIDFGSTATLAAAPFTAAITQVNFSSASLAWTDNGNPNGTEYRTQASTAADFSGTNVGNDYWSVSTSTDMVGLFANTTYYFRVQARNWNSVESAFLVFGDSVTMPYDAASAVSTFTAVSETAITAAWDANGNGPGTLYEAVLSTETGFQNGNSGDVLRSTRPEGATTADFTGLTANTTYYFSVRVISHAGAAGAWLALGSTSSLAAVPTADPEPFGAVYQSSASVRWGNGGNAVSVTTYTVAMSTGNTYPNNFSANVSFSTTPQGPVPGAFFNTLQSNATYYLFAAALNQAGAPTVFNQVGTTVTFVSLPATTVSTFPAVHLTSMTVSWDLNNNVVGSRFKIVITSGTAFPNSFPGNVIVSTDSETGPVVFSTAEGLVPNTTYYFHVRTLARDGTPTSDAALGSTVTKAAVPLAGGVPYSSVGQTGFDLTWLTNGNSSGTSYEVVASSGSSYPNAFSGNTAVSTRPEGVPLLTVAPLAANTTYYAFVRAVSHDAEATAYTALGSTSTRVYAPVVSGTPFTEVFQSSSVVSWSLGGNPLSITTFTVSLSTSVAYDAGDAANVERSTVAVSDPAFATLTGLAGNTTYYLFVHAIDHGGLSSATAVMGSTQTLVAPATSPLIGDSTFTAVNVSSVSIQWGDNGNNALTQYSAEASTSAAFSGAGVSVFSSGWASSTNTVFLSVSTNAVHHFRVKARNGAGVETEYFSLGSTTTLADAPGIPGSPFLFVGKSSVSASWTQATNPAGTEFKLEASTDAAFNPVLSESGWSTALSAEITGLLGESTYYFRAAARNLSGVLSAYADLGSTITALSPPAAPIVADRAPRSMRLDFSGDGNRGGETIPAWSAATALPAARHAHASAISGGRLYAAGGVVSGTPSAEVWRADILNNGTLGAWTAMTPLPAARESHALLAWGGRLYAIGGFEGAAKADVYWTTLDSNGNVGEWTAAQPLPGARYRHGAAVHNGFLYVFGGDNGVFPQSTVYSAAIGADGTLGSWSAQTALPSARAGHAVAVSSGRVFISGGLGAGLETTVWRADLSGGAVSAWTVETPLPQGRFRHAAAASRERLYAIGGFDGSTARGEVFVASVSANGTVGQWAQTGALSTGRFMHSAAFDGPRLFAIGGSDGASAFSSVEASSWTGTQYLGEAATDAGFTAVVSSRDWSPGTSIELVGLIPNTTYYVRARARGSAGGETANLAFGEILTPAARPESAASTFTVVETSSITAAYASAGNAAGTEYQLELSTASDFTGVPALSGWSTTVSTTVDGLISNTSYYLRVQARGWDKLPSPFTPLGSTWTLAAVPFGETISNVQTGGFSLSWNGAGNPGWTLFEAEVSTTAGFSAIAASSATQETSAVFAGLISASTYYARVRAFNGGGTPSTYTAVASTFTGVDAVAPGRILSPAAYQSGASGGLSIEIPVSGDDGYAGDLVAGSRFFVQWSTADPAGVSWSTASAQIQTSTGPIVAGSTSYIELTGIPVSTNAALRVWVEDEAGNYSAPSDTFTAYSSPFAFTRVSAAGVSIATETALALDGQDRLVVLYANGASLLRTYDSGVWSGAETADSGGSGGFSALALDGGGGVHIVGQGSVRYSSRTASGPWNSATAFAGGEGHASVAVDGGAAQIVYNDGSAGAHTLRHGRYEGGIWQTSVVDAGAAQVGRYPRLALDGSGSGRVSYSDTSNGNLKFASWDGSAWNTFTVAATGSGDARSSLAIDAEDGSHIAFRDNATGELKFASAAVPGIWNAVEIDAGDMDLPALALDGSGRPHIAYVDAARGDLKYATHDGVKWSTQTVDSLGSVSGGPDIVVTGTGGIWISYRGANGELKAASWAAGVSGAIGGNAHGRGRAPRALAGTAASATSIQWTWLDNAANELGYRLYGSEISTGPYTLLADTATITAVTGKGTLASFVESGLTANATYYRFVAAVNAGGVSISSLAAAYPFSSVDGTPPSIVVNQAGDTVWRSSNSGLYDVDFSDVGGSGLDYFKVKASTVAGGAGPDLIAFTAVELAIGSNTYTADWSLPTTVWNVLLEGATNYITIEAADGLANAATQVDAFFVLKDTTPPVLIDNQSGDDVVRGSPGTVYDLDARDTGSGFSAFEYSASLIPASADASLIAWTSLGAGLGTTNFLSDWQVDFASLASGVTNYISVRAFDRTGSSTTIVDAFYILKDVDPSSVGITVPTDTYRSSLATLSGTASDPSGVGGVEVSVRRDPPSGLYWNGAGFLSVSRVWIAASGTATWTLSPGIPWQDAVAYEIVARSSDTLGNFAVAYATASFTLDASSPSASVSVPTPLATIGALALISGTASDGGAGVSALEVNLRRNRDGLWWDFSTETWGAVPVSSVTAGTGTWSLTPSAVLQANLEHQTSYFIAVVARDLAVPSLANAFLSVGSTFTFSDTTPPSAITTLSALTGASPGEIELSWTAPGDDADAGTILLGEYRIHYSTVAGTVFSSASAQISISTALASPGRLERYTAGELLSGTTYYLRVFARDDADNWSAISNGATAYALNQPDTTIRGHVMKVSSEGITGVLIEAYDGGNVLLASANSVADGSGTFTLNALPVSAVQTVKVSWIAEEITSSVWLDGIPTGTGGVDFFLEIDYTLAELTGTLGTLAETSASPSGFLLAAKQTNFKQSEIELFQRSRRIATVGVDPAGRWRIGNLLPGKYGVRAFNGFEYTKLQEVELLEGEVKDVSFVFDPLPEGEVFAFPNPARRSTTVRFRSSLPGLEAEIRIFDLAGSLVRQIPGSQMTSTAPGLYHAVWDLKNMNGENAASGVYLFIVKVKGSNGQSAKVVKKLAVVK